MTEEAAAKAKGEAAAVAAVAFAELGQAEAARYLAVTPAQKLAFNDQQKTDYRKLQSRVYNRRSRKRKRDDHLM